MISGFVLLLPEICCPVLVASMEGRLGWTVSHSPTPLPLLPPAGSCMLLAGCKLQPRPWPHTLCKKCLPSLHVSTAIAQTRPRLEQCSRPVFLADEPHTPPCHRCQRRAAAAPLHGPSSGLVVKNFSIKNGSKSLEKTSNHFVTL